MKHIINLSKYWLIAILVFGFFGCKPEMDLINPNAITTKTFYQTDAELITAVNAAYNPLANAGLYGRYSYYSFLSRGDDFVETHKAVGIAEIIPVAQFNALPNNKSVIDMWRDLYGGIYASNLAIEVLNAAPETVTESLRLRLLGEAHFLRGFYLFLLGSNYGPTVPFLTRTPQTEDDLHPRNSEPGVLYNQIIADFTRASELLPARSVMFQNEADRGRVAKGAAQGMLAKAYMYRPILDWGQPAQFDLAAPLLREVIYSGEYELMANFRTNHLGCEFFPQFENNRESLFEVQFKNDEGSFNPEPFIYPETGDEPRDNSTWRMQEVGMYDGIGGSWWNLMPTRRALDQFEDGDPRKFMSIWFAGGARYTQGGTGGVGGITRTFERWVPGTALDTVVFGVRKNCFDFSTADLESGINDRLLRFSDILLLYAECLIELNREAEAVPYINMVRQRANNVVPSEQNFPELWYRTSPGRIPMVEDLIAARPVINGVRIDDMTQAIRHERFVELFAEYQRYYDLLRWSHHPTHPIDLVEVLGGKGFRPGREFLPFPNSELDVNRNLLPGMGNW